MSNAIGMSLNNRVKVMLAKTDWQFSESSESRIQIRVAEINERYIRGAFRIISGLFEVIARDFLEEKKIHAYFFSP